MPSQAPRASSLLLLAALLTWCAGARAQDENLAELDLLTLMSMDVTVTSAAKRAQSTSDAAAAVYVITREEIRRSSATSVPDLLRTVPGLQVARVSTRTWAVTARGFNSQFANKLQVLVDGRSIYAKVFSGVMWEEQFLPLGQIERIEIVRGPGGALWGVNAVNGVINIITRGANDEAGLHMSASSGAYLDHAAAVHYGVRSETLAAHVEVDTHDADPFKGDRNDLDHSQIGALIERRSGAHQITAQAQFAQGEFGEAHSVGDSVLPPSADIGSLSLAWSVHGEAGALSQMQTNYNWSDRGRPGSWDERTLGLDLQHTTARHGRHLASFGAGYAHIADEQTEPGAAEAFLRPSLTYDRWNVYFQHESFWFDDQVRLIAGAKFEDFSFGDPEFQPTLRGLWRVTSQHTLWAAASRAARAPARFELDPMLEVPGPEINGLPSLVSIRGTPTLQAERLDAYEFGWRWRLNQVFSIDLALFQHEYDRLISEEAGAPQLILQPSPHFVLPLVYANFASARGRGAELAVEWAMADRLRWILSAQRLDLDLPVVESSLNGWGGDPDYSWSLRARYDVTADVELDLTLRAVDQITVLNVPGYESVDVRMGWRATPNLDLTLSVENLLDDNHHEFFSEVSQARGASFGRSAFARFNWRAGR